MPRSAPFAVRLYRTLLRLYPQGFREEYGPELCATFAERAREYGGPLGPVLASMAAVADVVPNALGVQLDVLRQDVGYSVRSLRHAPGFALTAVLVVALGVGANTAAFSLADFVLLRPLAFAQPDRLMRIWETTPGYGRMEFSPANFRDTKSIARSFQDMGAYTDRAVSLLGQGEPRRLNVALVTPTLMRVLGVPAMAGRTIAPDDSAGPPVTVLSYGLWQTQFGADPAIIGKVVRLDDTPRTVVGVMPASYLFPSRDTQLWIPLVFREPDYQDRNDNYIKAVARLRDGVSPERARAEVVQIGARLQQIDPKANESTGLIGVDMRDSLSERSRLMLLALCGAALCILMLACANLASLLLVRASQRSRELAVRAALGAGRERLVRQLATESLGLALVGGVLGVGLAAAGVPLLSQLVPNSLPIAERPSVDLRVLSMAAALVVLTGLAFGIGPAIAAGRSRALDALRGGARGGSRNQRVRAVLVIVEVAASVVLLVSSGLLIRAVMRIQATDPGFRAEHVLTLRTELPWSRYALTDQRMRLYDRVIGEIRAVPGVQSAAYTTGLPLRLGGGIWPVSFGTREVVRGQQSSASLRFVTPAYFRAMGIPLRAGRELSEQDDRAHPNVAVVSASMARRFWPDESPLGKHFTFALEERTVVGVVSDVMVRGLERESEPQVYLPAPQVPDSSLIFYRPRDLVVRTTGAPDAIVPAVRRIIAAADPEIPVTDVQTMTEIVSGETASRMTQLRLLGISSLIALLIAGIGIHGLLAFAVSHRTRELGVRRALGEQAGSIVRRVMREGLVLASVGVAVGVLVAYLAARAMSALLMGVQPGDPTTMAIAAAICGITALLGCLRPAHRAANIDPIQALRTD